MEKFYKKGLVSQICDRDKKTLIQVCKKGRRSTLRQIVVDWNSVIGLNLSRECCRKWIHKCEI